MLSHDSGITFIVANSKSLTSLALVNMIISFPNMPDSSSYLASFFAYSSLETSSLNIAAFLFLFSSISNSHAYGIQDIYIVMTASPDADFFIILASSSFFLASLYLTKASRDTFKVFCFILKRSIHIPRLSSSQKFFKIKSPSLHGELSHFH